MKNSIKSFWVRFFSNFFWVRINHPPKWVIHKTQGYDDYFTGKYHQLPYDRIKKFKGNKFIYKVYYETIGQGKIQEKFYVKRR